MYFIRLTCVVYVCIIANEEQAPTDMQQEDDDIVNLILQLEGEQRQRQEEAGLSLVTRKDNQY